MRKRASPLVRPSCVNQPRSFGSTFAPLAMSMARSTMRLIIRPPDAVFMPVFQMGRPVNAVNIRLPLSMNCSVFDTEMLCSRASVNAP